MDTIYSLFQKVVKEHENAPAIIENDRAMTFWRAVPTMVRYDHVQLSAGSTQHRHRHASPNRDDCLDSGGYSNAAANMSQPSRIFPPGASMT